MRVMRGRQPRAKVIDTPEILERAALFGVGVKLAYGSVDFLNLHRAGKGLQWLLVTRREDLTAYLAEKERAA